MSYGKLLEAKSNFLKLLGNLDDKELSQFTAWADLKLSEIKVLGCLTVDAHQEKMLPKWLSKGWPDEPQFSTASRSSGAFSTPGMHQADLGIQQTTPVRPSAVPHLNPTSPDAVAQHASSKMPNAPWYEAVISSPTTGKSSEISQIEKDVCRTRQISSSDEDILEPKRPRLSPVKVALNEVHFCSKCQLVLGSAQQMQEHMRTHHKQPVSASKLEGNSKALNKKLLDTDDKVVSKRRRDGVDKSNIIASTPRRASTGALTTRSLRKSANSRRLLSHLFHKKDGTKAHKTVPSSIKPAKSKAGTAAQNASSGLSARLTRGSDKRSPSVQLNSSSKRQAHISDDHNKKSVDTTPVDSKATAQKKSETQDSLSKTPTNARLSWNEADLQALLNYFQPRMKGRIYLAPDSDIAAFLLKYPNILKNVPDRAARVRNRVLNECFNMQRGSRSSLSEKSNTISPKDAATPESSSNSKWSAEDEESFCSYFAERRKKNNKLSMEEAEKFVSTHPNFLKGKSWKVQKVRNKFCEWRPSTEGSPVVSAGKHSRQSGAGLDEKDYRHFWSKQDESLFHTFCMRRKRRGLSLAEGLEFAEQFLEKNPSFLKELSDPIRIQKVLNKLKHWKKKFYKVSSAPVQRKKAGRPHAPVNSLSRPQGEWHEIFHRYFAKLVQEKKTISVAEAKTFLEENPNVLVKHPQRIAKVRNKFSNWHYRNTPDPTAYLTNGKPASKLVPTAVGGPSLRGISPFKRGSTKGLKVIVSRLSSRATRADNEVSVSQVESDNTAPIEQLTELKEEPQSPTQLDNDCASAENIETEKSTSSVLEGNSNSQPLSAEERTSDGNEDLCVSDLQLTVMDCGDQEQDTSVNEKIAGSSEESAACVPAETRSAESNGTLPIVTCVSSHSQETTTSLTSESSTAELVSTANGNADSHDGSAGISSSDLNQVAETMGCTDLLDNPFAE